MGLSGQSASDRRAFQVIREGAVGSQDFSAARRNVRCLAVAIVLPNCGAIFQRRGYRMLSECVVIHVPASVSDWRDPAFNDSSRISRS